MFFLLSFIGHLCRTFFVCLLASDGENETANNAFSCNISEHHIIGENDRSEYKIKLYYPDSAIFRPVLFYVIDNGSNYSINSFCGPIQFYYWITVPKNNTELKNDRKKDYADIILSTAINMTF